MPTATAPLLAPYTSPPPARSLSLITSLLGTTSNWLVLRILCDALYSSSSSSVRGRWQEDVEIGIGIEGEGVTIGGRKGTMRVILISFLRGWEFWRTEAKRLGVDLTKLANERKFAFVDGLTELFSSENLHSAPVPTTLRGRPPAAHASRFISTARSHPATHPVPVHQKASGPTKLHWSKMANLEALERGVISAIDNLHGAAGEEDRVPATEDVLLVIDQPDMLLAATGPDAGVGALEIKDMIMSLRQHVHSTLVTLAADSPLIHYEEPGTPLEMEHATLVVGMAYQARMVIQLRGLETGVARDVSGVLQVNKGTQFMDLSSSRDLGEDYDLEPKEVLYYVQGDGAVRVFGRGE
ncbi:elongator complex protein 6 [Coccidioides immitis RS]|uniref:Elongator complex protein 6 n=1 Tax=Coccidioides immitis (strain RS) TaxID=246410 RepID=J3KGX5_COCIM|nr:elongator complex protein 6 [Coccidioides immitis RS]EAS35042.3 elongator complex protein 6 [Coccidioides immitis RS]